VTTSVPVDNCGREAGVGRRFKLRSPAPTAAGSLTREVMCVLGPCVSDPTTLAGGSP
jgi:hypothetical protein